VSGRDSGEDGSGGLPLRAVRPIPRSQSNDGYGANSSPSREDLCSFAPPNCDVHSRDQRWQLYVDSSRPIDPKQPLVYIASCWRSLATSLRRSSGSRR
jgi:hypothetical protein